MMKRISLLFCTALLCAGTVLTACGPSETASSPTPVSGAPANTAPAERAQRMQEYGRLERLRLDIPEDAPSAVCGVHFTISAQELDALTEEYVIFNGCDRETAREKALTLLIEQYTLCAWAEEEGITVDEASLDAIIADEQESDADDPTALQHFLKGFGGDEAFYRTFQRASLKREETVRAFYEARRTAYEGEDGASFEAEYRALLDERIASEQIELVQEGAGKGADAVWR